MEKVYEELEEAKAEMEKLKCKLDNKERIIKQLSSTSDEERVGCSEKVQKLEEENRQLLLSIEEANEEGRKKQLKLNACIDEAESLKALVSELQNRCSEAGNETKSPKDRTWEGGGLVQELEERQRKVEDELKWKVEQFKHLEEAHEKLRDQLRVSKSEWESEKSSLIDEISKLQESLDDGHRTAEGLKSQLAMCKQLLDNEESRRKRLEEQVSEMKILLESAPNQGSEGKTEMECSTVGEEEVTTLRYSLRMKEMEYKDMEYKAKKLEKDNQEFLASIRELHEAQIPRAVPTPSSWAKLRSKLKSLEQTHKECSANLRAKEAEWSSRAEKMTRELNRCSSSLQIKDQVIDELKKELEGCNSSLTQLKMQNEELSLMLQLMRSECSEVGSDEQSKEGALVHLMGQLEKEREEKLDMQKELEMYKDLVEQAADTETKLKDELQEVYDALDNIDSELTDKTNEGSELEFELQNWKSIAERLKMQVEEIQEMRKELEESLLAQAELEEMLKRDTEEKERRISNLEEQILLFDQEIRIEEEDDVMEEDGKLSRRSKTDDDDQQQLELLARELEEAILAHIEAERLQEDIGQEEKQTRVVQEFDDDKMRIDLEGDEVCAAKENVNQQNPPINKTVDSIIEERSPFRQLN